MKRKSDNVGMKRVTVVLVAVVLLVSPRPVFAIDQSVLTSDQIEYIRNNCADTQTALGSVRATDKVAYVNIDQQLKTLSDRLMAPMNSRVAINKLDGVALAKITVDFNTEIKRLQSRYRDYEQSIDTITMMGCYNQPVEFYDNLTALLQKRVAVRTSLDKLTELSTQYRAGVVVVQKQVLAGGAQ